MKIRLTKVLPLTLAAGLQVLPVLRVACLPQVANVSTFAIVMKWVAATAALLGSYHAVSGASTVITSPTTARGTNGVPFTYRITTGPDVANRYAASPLPPGLTVSTTSGRISGTPTQSGFWTVRLTASDSGRPDRTVTANLALTIVDPVGGTAPAITTQPASQTVNAGANVTFNVVASGTAPLRYQWRKGASNLANATNASLALNAVTAAQAGNYTVTVANSSGSVTSQVATLTVRVPPAITTQPVDQTVNVGGTAAFAVTATGTAPLRYQWRKAGSNLANATNANLTLNNVQASQAGDYTVVITNLAGSVTSSVARLTVQTPTLVPPRLGSMQMSNGVYRLRLTGATNVNCVIWGSSNLIHWTIVASNRVIGGNWNVAHTNALSARQRFYRATVSP